MRKKKPIILATAILLAIVTAVGASTFAWFTAYEEVTNKVQSAKFADGDVVIIETFDPDDRLQPGVEINKDVGVINTGDTPALARISFTEAMMKLQAAVAPATDMQIRSDTIYTPTASGTTDPFLPVLVDISAYSGWTKWSDTPLKFLDTDSEDNMDELLDKDIEFVYLKTSSAGNPDKYSFAAYAALGTTPETYQRVELRPELFNMVRDTDASRVATATIAGYDNYGLKVTLEDPATPVVLYTAEGGRFWSFTSLAWENGGTPRAADWRNTVAASAPIGATPPPATAYAAGKMPAVTDNTNKYLELLFWSANVDDSAPTAGKWYYYDGWFYYIGLVEPGTSTPLLLDAIYLSTAATSEYANMKFDLTVVMEALQATSAAVAASDGWNLPTGAGSLGEALQNLCPS